MEEAVTLSSGRTVMTSQYGDPQGSPVIFHSGSPSTRFKRPEFDRAARDAGALLLVPDRPGYGRSTQQPGRTVADAARDVAELVHHHGWQQFAVAGGSGGGPHALACAALLHDRVTRCAVAAGICPPDITGAEPADDDPDPCHNRTAWLAAHDPTALRAQLVQTGLTILAAAKAGGPELPPEPGAPDAGRALDDPQAMMRLRATFTDSIDGWLDDNTAFGLPWGFAVHEITAPVSLRFGDQDTRSRRHALVLHDLIPHSELQELKGGHLLSEAALHDLLAWCLDGP